MLLNPNNGWTIVQCSFSNQLYVVEIGSFLTVNGTSYAGEGASGTTSYGEDRLVVGPDEWYITNKFLECWTHVDHKVGLAACYWY